MEENTILTQVDPTTFEYQEYKTADEQLIPSSSFDTNFIEPSDYIELYVYDDNKQIVSPDETYELKQYKVQEGDIVLNPTKNLKELGFTEGNYYTVYNTYRRRLGSSIKDRYYIDEISPSRTEIRLKTNQLDDQQVFNTFVNFQEYRETRPYFVDFQLNFGNNQQVIANNIDVTPTTIDQQITVLIKLYEPLPPNFSVKDTLWIVEEISTPQAYKVEYAVEEVEIDDDFEFIKGPNFNLNVNNEVGVASDTFTYNSILETPLTSSLQQLKSLLAEKSININIDYSKYNQFIKFSTAEERLKNFYYKASLLEATHNQLEQDIYSITGSATSSIAFSSSKATLEAIVDSTIDNFDGYEYFLYFNSGSSASWPKSTSTLPYTLYSTGSTQVAEWFGSLNEGSIYYGGQISSASLYDENNNDALLNTIPEYLVEDPANNQYQLFIEMIGQHFDNVWTYTKDVTNKFDADNRLDYGISKDLVADAIREFGIKLYSNNYDQDDLYQAFLGITSEGSTFPISNITGSSPAEGIDLVTNAISASSAVIAQNDVLKRVYKRIYHNIPYLLKTKGTKAGLRALISTFGISNTILDVKEYGGSPKKPAVYKTQENIYDYYLGMTGSQSVQTEFKLNSDWSSSYDRPQTVMFRIKPETIHSSSLGPTNNIQKVFSLDTGLTLTLEYTGSSGIVSSYSGSVVDPEYQFGNLKLFPNGQGTPLSSSVYLPFFNGDWWSVMVNHNQQSGYTLTAKNKNSEYVSTSAIQYSSINTLPLTGSTEWISATSSDFGTALAPASHFSGGLQEIRYYTSDIPDNVFEYFTLNPQSYVGTGVNTAPEELAFRASLGGELYTGSVSIHPKTPPAPSVPPHILLETGYSLLLEDSGLMVLHPIDKFKAGIHSFEDDSNFNITSSAFGVNREKIARNQIPAGINSEINNKIIIDTSKLESTTLSPMRSIQQKDYSNQRDVDSGYVEVAFSPAHQINKDIVGQVGYFNLGDYLGNLSNRSTNTNSYPSLDILRDEYFAKYAKSYDLNDFVRLIKFYDNSLFKMVKDFTPSNVSLSSGVVVKQHILERNKHRRTLVSSTNETLTGSISQVETFSGGAGGQVNRYQNQSKPTFDITQSWSEIIQTLKGPTTQTTTDQSGFYNGEYGNPTSDNSSFVNVVKGDGGVDCSQFTNPTFQDTQVTPVFLTYANFSEEEFLSRDTIPNRGIVWLWHDGFNVKHIKVASRSREGVSILRELSQATSIPILLNNPSVNPIPPSLPKLKSGFYTWEVTSKQIYDNYVYFETNIIQSPLILTSEDANIFDIEFDSTGDFIWYASSSGTPANPLRLDGIYESIPQGYFPSSPTYPREQFFRGWDGSDYLIEPNEYIESKGIIVDSIGNFDTGTGEVNTAFTSSLPSVYNRLAETPKTPWFMNAPQQMVSYPSALIQDQDPNVIPRSIVVCAIYLTPITTNCSTLNNNSNGVTVAVRYQGNEELFTLGTTPINKNKLILKEGKNGFAVVKDIILYNSADDNVDWTSSSITSPNNPTSTSVNLPSGKYGVYKYSAQNEDKMIVQVETINGKQTITQIAYCF